jgi:hypothetical protein
MWGGEQLWPLAMLWVWLLDQWVMFVPSLDGVKSGTFFSGFAAQVTGIVCDTSLLVTFFYLWKREGSSGKHDAPKEKVRPWTDPARKSLGLSGLNPLPERLAVQFIGTCEANVNGEAADDGTHKYGRCNVGRDLLFNPWATLSTQSFDCSPDLAGGGLA